MATTISTALVYGKLYAGGASPSIRNFPTKTYQILMQIGGSETSYSFQWTIDTNYEYYFVEKDASYNLIVSISPYVAPDAAGESGIISDNQLFLNPTGIDVADIIDRFGVTQLYFTMIGSAGDSMNVNLQAYTYNDRAEVISASKELTTSSGEPITTNINEIILAENV